MDNTAKKTLTATQDFKDKEGKQHKRDEQFQASEQDAQEYIRAGNAREEQQKQNR